MRRTKRTIVVLSLALASCRGPMAVPTTTPQLYTVHIFATTATYPLLQELAYGYQRPGTLLAVNSAAAGWSTLYDWLRAGDVPYALTTYLPAQAGLWVAPIGQDGIAIIVHPTNTVPALTIPDVRRLFRGQIASWAAAGGADLPVVVVSREAGADTRFVFEDQVMGGQPITLAARLALSSQSMIDIVANTPGAVGFVSMGWISGDSRVRALPLQAAPDDPQSQPQLPTPETVSAATYPLRAPILVVGLNPPDPGTIYYDWFAWMQSEEGQQIVTQRYGEFLR